MGYSYRNHGQIKDYYPDNDENTLYLEGNYSVIELLEAIRHHFPNTAYTDLEISSEYIHTRCLTYDLYIPKDYDYFIVVRKIR